jgi:ribosomal protein L11 methyltransferase
VIRLAVRVARAHAEIVLAELLELAPSGVEEADVGPDAVEYAVYGAPGELPELPALRAAAGEALVEISTSEIADDWDERWRAFHRPVLIEPPAPRGDPRERGRGRPPAAVPALYVRPPWEAPVARAGAGAAIQTVRELVIDPGRAFGTGAHATTRLCLSLLLELAATHGGTGPLLDLGTGSGVLAIAAAMLGFEPVTGLDHDPLSVQAAAANAAANDVAVAVGALDVRTARLPWPPGDGAGPVVVANLLGPLLLALAERLPAAPPHLIVGGLLAHETDEVADAFGHGCGLRVHERRREGDWAALWLRAR